MNNYEYLWSKLKSKRASVHTGYNDSHRNKPGLKALGCFGELLPINKVFNAREVSKTEPKVIPTLTQILTRGRWNYNAWLRSFQQLLVVCCCMFLICFVQESADRTLPAFMTLLWFRLAHNSICFQVISLHKGGELESISNFLIGNRFHATLRVLSLEICNQCYGWKVGKAEQRKPCVVYARNKIRKWRRSVAISD